MSKHTTEDGITVIKGRGVAIQVDNREMDRIDAEESAQRVAEAERSRAFALLDRLDNAKGRLKGTAAVMSALIATYHEEDDEVSATIERWLSVDVAEIDDAFDGVFHGVLDRLPPAGRGQQ